MQGIDSHDLIFKTEKLKTLMQIKAVLIQHIVLVRIITNKTKQNDKKY